MTTQNLALDISSVKLQIASVTKLHPKACPAYPAVWGASKEALSCSQKQHCALSEAESSWRVTAWKLTKHKGHWASCQESENPFFRIKTVALLSWLHGKNHQYTISASSWRWMALVMCSPGTRNWGQTSPGSVPAAAQLGLLGLLLPGPNSSSTQEAEQAVLGTIRTLLPISLYTRFSLAYTWNYTLFNICLHFKTSGATNPTRGNEDHCALWKILLYYINIWVNYL